MKYRNEVAGGRWQVAAGLKNELVKYRIVCLGVAFILLLLSTQRIQAQGYKAQLQTPAPRNEKLSTPKAGVIPGGMVETDSTGQVRRLWGKVQVGGRTPQDAADKFRKRYSAPLGLTNDLEDLQIERKTTSLTGEHVIYRQTYAGLPVFGGEIGVHLDRSHNVVALTHDFQAIAERRGIALPEFPERAIASAITAASGLPDNRHVPKPDAGVMIVE